MKYKVQVSFDNQAPITWVLMDPSFTAFRVRLTQLFPTWHTVVTTPPLVGAQPTYIVFLQNPTDEQVKYARQLLPLAKYGAELIEHKNCKLSK